MELHKKFPYIICWGLSHKKGHSLKSCTQFPYIICWGLSRRQSYSLFGFLLGFRTLYVEVYLLLISKSYCTKSVSVHYMLRFITFAAPWACSALFVSVHYMLRFILLFIFSVLVAAAVSVHYMLRFIELKQTKRKQLQLSFRTLYVEVYPLWKLMSEQSLHCFRTLYVEVYH